MLLQVLLHLDDLVRLGAVGILGAEAIVLEHLLHGLCLLLGRLAVGQSRMAQVDVSRRADVSVLLLVDFLQALHGGVALGLHPHLVLLLAALVQGLSFLAEPRIVSNVGTYEVVNLLCRAVMVRVGKLCQPRCCQLIVVCHNRLIV